MGSRWRSSSPAGDQDSVSKEGSSSRGRGRRGRMYSASDPIRRPRSRQGSTSEWALLPWQVCAAVACMDTSLTESMPDILCILTATETGLSVMLKSTNPKKLCRPGMHEQR
jgi:hypothetical protein